MEFAQSYHGYGCSMPEENHVMGKSALLFFEQDDWQ
jgi:hypothetical protein